MNSKEENLHVLHDIRSMMEKSSRFVSLSGWSGIGAGLCALAGAYAAGIRIREYYASYPEISCTACLKNELIVIAALVFTGALISAILFTFLKSRAQQVPFMGAAAKRLLWNTLLPMAAGGILILKIIELKQYELVASSCLIFYGLGLVNGSKYTMGEVRYLGYGEILTGVLSLFMIRSGLYCWAFGFGILHIVYGVAMWWKYERRKTEA